MKKAVMCIVQNHNQADAVVGQLQRAGFANSDISVLFPDKKGTRDFAHEHNTKAPEGAVAGASAGGVLGGTLGLLAGIGTLAIPGLGPFIAAGPILATLSGAAAGATVGGVTGALVGMGIPEVEAKRYEGKLRRGNILIAVSAANRDQQKLVETIFEDAQADAGSDAGQGAGTDAGAATAPTKVASPVPGRKVTYPYGVKNSRYAAGYHTGDDYAAPTGSNAVAVRSGTIRWSNDNGGAYGKWMGLDADNGRTYVYCHLSVRGLAAGKKVEAGQVIGKVGATGNVTGPHLHFEDHPLGPFVYAKGRKPAW